MEAARRRARRTPGTVAPCGSLRRRLRRLRCPGWAGRCRSSGCSCRRWRARSRPCSPASCSVWFRHATIASRIFGLFVTFLVPAILLYPSLNFFAELAIQRLIIAYSGETRNHSARLLGQLYEAQREIDALSSLSDLVTEPGDVTSEPDPKNAFFVWSQTVFAGVTTDVGRRALRSHRQPSPAALRSTFPNTPAAGSSRRRWRPASGTCSASRCRSVRRSDWCCMPNAASAHRGPARMRRRSAAIVLHLAVDDYRTLPFITSQSPYFELFRSNQTAAARRGAARQRRARRGLRLGPRTRLHLRAVSVADHRAAVPAHLRSRSPAVLGADPACRRHLPRLLHERSRPASTRSAIRFSRCSITSCTWRSSARWRARRSCSCCWARRSSRASAASGRVSGARCCARFARASTASCSSRSCSPRSFRC